MAANYGDRVPKEKIKQILINYDITPEDLKNLKAPKSSGYISIDQLADKGYLEEVGDEDDRLSDDLEAIRHRDDDDEDEIETGANAYDAGSSDLDVASPEDMQQPNAPSDIDEPVERPMNMGGVDDDIDEPEDNVSIPVSQPTQSSNPKIKLYSKPSTEKDVFNPDKNKKVYALGYVGPDGRPKIIADNIPEDIANIARQQSGEAALRAYKLSKFAPEPEMAQMNESKK